MSDGIPTALTNQMEELKQVIQANGTPQEEAPINEPEETPIPQVEEPKADVTPESQPEKWEHKFQVLDGKYRAETSRYLQEINQLKAEIEKLKTQPASQTNAIPKSTDITEEEVMREFSAEYIEDWGIDHCKQQLALVKKYASQNQAQTPQPQPQQQQQGDPEKDRFYNNLDRLKPDWQAVFESEPFQKWLGIYDSLYGMTMGEMLDVAVDNRDEFRVVALFEKFAADPNVPGKTGNRSSRQTSVDVMPNSVPSVNQPQADGMMSMAEWQARLDELTKAGMNPTEVAEKQKELMALVKSGKVQQDAPQAGNPTFVV